MRVLVYPEMKPKKGIPYTREHLRRREQAGTFPMHIDLGEGRIGWIEEEVDTWITERAARRAPVAAVPAPLKDRTQPASDSSGRLKSDALQSTRTSPLNRRSDQVSRQDRFGY